MAPIAVFRQKSGAKQLSELFSSLANGSIACASKSIRACSSSREPVEEIPSLCFFNFDPSNF
jgi:hypothetical protein